MILPQIQALWRATKKNSLGVPHHHGKRDVDGLKRNPFRWSSSATSIGILRVIRLFFPPSSWAVKRRHGKYKSQTYQNRENVHTVP